jgi:hypothetical protein
VPLVLADAGLPVQARRWIAFHRQRSRRAGQARARAALTESLDACPIDLSIITAIAAHDRVANQFERGPVRRAVVRAVRGRRA